MVRSLNDLKSTNQQSTKTFNITIVGYFGLDQLSYSIESELNQIPFKQEQLYEGIINNYFNLIIARTVSLIFMKYYAINTIRKI